MKNIVARTSASLALFAATAVLALNALAQTAPPHRIAFVNVGPQGPNQPNVAALNAGLRDLGYVDGRTITIDYRWGNGHVERLPALVSELIALKPDLIVSTGGVDTARAVKSATSTIPVLFVTGDPLAEGLVTSLAKPGGNMTGISVVADEVETKRLELLKQVAPKVRRIAVIWNPARFTADASYKAFVAAAQSMAFTTVPWEARNATELETAMKEIAAAHIDALAVLPDPVLGFERQRIVEFALRNKLPGVYFWREFAQIGGLLSYGASLTGVYRRLATYVDKILKGAKPGDLPVEQPTAFELVINLKTAKALGLSISPTLLTMADEVIQ